MKKGTAVKFVGNENRTPYNKTYIWQVVKISETETGYIIEHPQGTLLNEQTEKTDFTGIDTSKLHQGKRYMMAFASELIDLDAISENETNKEATIKQLNPEKPDEIISLQLPKRTWEAISYSVVSFREITKQQKAVFIASGMTQADFDDLMHHTEKFIIACKTQNIELDV